VSFLRAANISLAFGSRTLFDRLNLTIAEDEYVGLVGVNGSGKSTLMKILAGVTQPDGGELQLRRGARITYLPQEPEFPVGATVASELAVASQSLRASLEEHAALAARLSEGTGIEQPKSLDRLSQLSSEIDRLGGWDTEHHAKTLLDRLGVKEWDRPLTELSGGLRKRVAIARALLSKPDLLLLDEPTNHLDADTVEWLENELDDSPGALLLVTHDRYFLDHLADRIVEIAPGGMITSYLGNYEAYLEQKLVALEEAEVQEHKRQQWIRQEVAWLRKGVEARRTKSKARIERARKLLQARGFRRPEVAALRAAEAPRLGQTVLEAKQIRKRFGEQLVLDEVELILQRGERIGLVGPNGVGKTTFLRVLLGELEPDSGQRLVGKNTRIAYYDQVREQLDPEQTVYQAASSEEQVEIGGKTVALRDYLEDLLFPVSMQRMQVKALSGGERNRLLLARLFLAGANLLVLDEPTNDLDIVTLNALERLLVAFTGSVLLVTHDRYFLDKVATSILAFEGAGKVVRYPGNYEMYRRLKAQRAEAPSAQKKSDPKTSPAPAQKKVEKLGYLQLRELGGMDAAIESAERRKREVEAALADPAIYSNAEKVQQLTAELQTISAQIERLYARWQELEQLR
jgi:ATP-binding cassette subfamily F protein uup